jgi:hypothetical protein
MIELPLSLAEHPQQRIKNEVIVWTAKEQEAINLRLYARLSVLKRYRVRLNMVGNNVYQRKAKNGCSTYKQPRSRPGEYSHEHTLHRRSFPGTGCSWAEPPRQIFLGRVS